MEAPRFISPKPDRWDETREFWIGHEGAERAFTVYPFRVVGSLLVDVPQLAVNGDSSKMWQMWRAAFGGDKEYEEFRAFIDKPENAVQAEQLAAAAEWLMGVTAGRPT